MRTSILLICCLIGSVAVAGSKDKNPKVAYHEMALGMRDAFNCGVLVEEHLHGRLKDNADVYGKEHATYNCTHVEEVLNSLDEPPKP